MIRAKFRCLSIEARYDNSYTVHLKPVWQKGGNSEENQSFWEATPNGSCELTFVGPPDMKPGDYFYLDLVKVGERSPSSWQLSSVLMTMNSGGNVDLSFYRVYDYSKPRPLGLVAGKLSMGIDSTKTKALDAFGDPGSEWQFECKFAEASDFEP